MKQLHKKNLLKRFLKRKVKITLGLIITFLISGNIGYAEFIIDETNNILTGKNNVSLTDYKSEEHNGKKLSEYKEIHIDVNNKSGLKTWSGKYDMPETDLYITVTGDPKKENLDGIHLTNWNPHIVLNKYVAEISSTKSDALNLSHDATSAYATINELDVKVHKGHGIRANASIQNDNADRTPQTNIITINNKSNIEILGNNSTGVYAGDDEKNIKIFGKHYGAESKGFGKIFLNGDTIIKTHGDNSNGIWAGRNGYIEVNNINIEAFGKNSYGIKADNENLIWIGFDNSKNRWGSTVVLKGENVKINLAKGGKAIYADSEYAKISTSNDKQIFFDVIGDIEANNKGKITLFSKDGSEIKGDVLSQSNGIIDLNLEKSYLEGKIDDYRWKNNHGNTNIILNNGVWNNTGKSFVTNLTLNNSNVLFKNNASSIDIQELKGKGNGTFSMNVNSNDKSQGNMIYVQNSAGGEYTIDLQKSDINNIKVGDKIRFATIGENSKNNNLTFKVNDIKEQGIKDVSFRVGHDNFVKGDKENSIYNDGNNKSGNTYVENNYSTGENWYLERIDSVDWTPIGSSTPVIPEKPKNDIAKSIIEMSKANYASAVYMDNLNKRLGDMTFAEGTSGLWVRMRNDRVGENEEYRLKNYMTQIGYDKSYSLKNGKEFRGIALDYTKGKMDYKNLNGNSKLDRYMVTAYDTILFNNGIYMDYIAKVGCMMSDFEVYGRETGNKVEGDYKNLVLGTGAEFGKKFSFSENRYIEPQIQLQYTYIDDTDYTTNQNTKVNYEEINSLIGRIGFRLGQDFYKENLKDNTIYLKLDANHEFLGEQKIDAKDNTGILREKYSNDTTWYDVGIGGAKNLTEDLYVYADIEKQFGENKDNSYQFNLGFRYKFNSLKDFTFSAESLFDFDKSEVKAEGKEKIKEVSNKINNNNIKGTFLIEGHTDWIGNEEYNQLLSEKRAKAVEKELKNNIEKEDIKYEVKGYGETRPIADNKTSEGRAKNRRVKIEFKNNK